MGSTARAIGFGLQKAALRRTRDNRLLARAARAYVTRTSGRRTRRRGLNGSTIHGQFVTNAARITTWVTRVHE